MNILIFHIQYIMKIKITFCYTPSEIYRYCNTRWKNAFKELIYMSEVYDMYIFLKRFKMNYKNISIYVGMFGRVIYNILRIFLRYPKK